MRLADSINVDMERAMNSSVKIDCFFIFRVCSMCVLLLLLLLLLFSIEYFQIESSHTNGFVCYFIMYIFFLIDSQQFIESRSVWFESLRYGAFKNRKCFNCGGFPANVLIINSNRKRKHDQWWVIWEIAIFIFGRIFWVCVCVCPFLLLGKNNFVVVIVVAFIL